MDTLMEKFTGWAAAHKARVHAIAGTIATLATLYATNSEVHAIVNSFLAQHAKLTALANAAVTIYLAYANMQKSAK